MSHLTADQLSALLDGELKGPARERAEDHLAACEACRDALGNLAANDASLGRALTHDPGEEYFAGFADRVSGRIKDLGRPKPVVRTDPLTRFLSRPRNLVVWGSAAALVVAAGVVFLAARDASHDVMRNPALERATSQTAPPPAASTPPAPAAVPAPSEADTRAERAPAPLSEAAPAPESKVTAPATPERAASPARAMRVQKNEAGEDVAVEPRQKALARPPAPVAQAPAAENPIVALKRKLAAQPLAGERGAAAPGASTPATQGFAVPPKPADESAGKTLADASKELPKPVEAVRRDEAANAIVTPPAPAAGLGASEEREAAVTTRACGVVRDASGRAVRGATVVMLGHGTTAVTDADGRYCIDGTIGADSVLVSVVGFKPRRARVQVTTAGALPALTVEPVGALASGPLAVRGGRAGEQSFDVKGLASRELAAFTGSARTLAGVAEAKLEAARLESSAQRYDAAAVEWARLVGSGLGPEADLIARERLAESRYSAWQLQPTPKRAEHAIEALTSYLTRAPQGASRQLAVQRLDRVRLGKQ